MGVCVRTYVLAYLTGLNRSKCNSDQGKMTTRFTMNGIGNHCHLLEKFFVHRNTVAEMQKLPLVFEFVQNLHTFLWTSETNRLASPEQLSKCFFSNCVIVWSYLWGSFCFVKRIHCQTRQYRRHNLTQLNPNQNSGETLCEVGDAIQTIVSFLDRQFNLSFMSINNLLVPPSAREDSNPTSDTELTNQPTNFLFFGLTSFGHPQKERKDKHVRT